MNNMFYLLISTSLFFMFGCNSETSTNEKQSESTEEVKPEKLSDFESPCELLQLEDVRKILELKSDISIKNDDKMYTHRTCKYEWEDGSMIKSQQIGTQTVSYEIPSEVMVVVARDASEANYRTVTNKVYKDPEELSGIGDLACWGANMNQLSFLKDGLFFHVHVMVSQDKAVNREKAIEFAKLIDSRL